MGNLSTDVALSATDIWAFGSRTTAAVPLAEHYNGTTWKKTDLPTPQGSASTTIVGALAVSAGDIWLAGDWKNAAGDYQTLSEHWNGTTWSIVATPDPASWANNYLYSMSAVSPTDIWAVGTSLSADDMTNATLVEHWNGSAWSVVKSPDPSKTYSAFQAVYATSDSSVLAVGSTENASSDVVALSERWNGTAWVRQSTPLPSGDSADTFGGLDPVSPTDVWTYAWQENSATEIVPLAERWNGTKWTVVPTPVPSGAEGTLLAGMSASSATDAWLVGGDLLSNGTGGIVLMHWNGTAWSLVNAPAPAGATDSQLTGVAAPTSTDAWAVGQTNPHGSPVTLHEHWNGTTWTLAQGV